MRFRRSMGPLVALLVALLVLDCKPAVDLTPPPAASPATEVALSGASVMVGVGDIASCSQRLSFGTARLVDSVLRADSIAKVRQRGLHAGRQRLLVRHDRRVQSVLRSLLGRSAKGNHQEPASVSRQPRVLNTECRSVLQVLRTGGRRRGQGLLQLRRRRRGTWSSSTARSSSTRPLPIPRGRRRWTGWRRISRRTRSSARSPTGIIPDSAPGGTAATGGSFRCGGFSTTTTWISYSTATITTTSAFVR